MTQHVVLSVDSPRDLPARIVDTDADVTMSLGKGGVVGPDAPKIQALPELG